MAEEADLVPLPDGDFRRVRSYLAPHVFATWVRMSGRRRMTLSPKEIGTLSSIYPPTYSSRRPVTRVVGCTRAQDRISSCRHRRRGRPELSGSTCGAAGGPPRRAESLFAFWPSDFDRLSALRKATASADAPGPRARELFPEPLPYGSLGNLRARTLHSRALNAGPDLQCQKANKNGRPPPPNRKVSHHGPRT